MDKPMFIFIKPDKDDNFKLTEEELKRYLEDAYNKGYNDGYIEARKNIPAPTITPYTPTPTQPAPYTSPTTSPFWYYGPTCTGVVTESIKVTGEQNEQR